METDFGVFQKIWLADDDLDDCEVFRDVVEQLVPSASLIIISNGEKLMSLLTPANKPDILFLDINMPLKTGLDCLVEIRAQRHFSRLPVVIFTSSTQDVDIHKSYGFGANLFYSKPTTFAKLIEDMGKLFKMNWNDPFTITSDHYINNKFVPFKLEK
jgi:CheY-like chemotaxis protein